MLEVPDYGTIRESASASSSVSTSESAIGVSLSENMQVKEKEDSRETATGREIDETSLDSEGSAQAGVRRIEAISSAWTKWSLAIAYLGIYAMSLSTSLEQQTTINLTVFATSAFAAHSLVSTVMVVQGVVNAVIKPPMSKIADVFGRFESFSIAVALYVIGYCQQAGSNNVRTYASAQIFYSAGSQGLQMLQQVFIADTSDLTWRALFSTIPDIPFLFTVWIGPIIATSIRTEASWRWGYGIWAIVLPVAFLPLALSLVLNQRKASKMGILPPSQFKGKSFLTNVKSIWFDLDVFGLLLLSAAISLILLPLTLAATASGGWSNPSMIAMIVVGCVCLAVFPFWERSEKLAPKAFFPKELFRERTVIVGVTMAFFYFMAFYLSVFPYFFSYLMVVDNIGSTAAGHITQTFSFTSTVSSIVVSFLIKWTGHYKYFVTFGGCIYLMGLGLMIAYRQEGASVGSLVGCQIAVGIGGGMFNVPAQLGVQASASHQQVAAATAVFLTILEIGGAVGNAISGAVWSNNIPKKLQAYLPPDVQDQAMVIYGNVTLAQTGWPMGSPERDAINRAYQETMHTLLIIAVCVAAPIIPLSLCMKNYRLNKMNQHVKGTVIGGSRQNAYSEDYETTPRHTDVADGNPGPPSKLSALLERVRGRARAD